MAHFNVQFCKVPMAHWLPEFRKQLSENEGAPTCTSHRGCYLGKRLMCLLTPYASIWLHPPRLGEQSDGLVTEWLCSMCCPSLMLPMCSSVTEILFGPVEPKGLCAGTLLLGTFRRDLDAGLG